MNLEPSYLAPSCGPDLNKRLAHATGCPSQASFPCPECTCPVGELLRLCLEFAKAIGPIAAAGKQLEVQLIKRGLMVTDAQPLDPGPIPCGVLRASSRSLECFENAFGFSVLNRPTDPGPSLFIPGRG